MPFSSHQERSCFFQFFPLKEKGCSTLTTQDMVPSGTILLLVCSLVFPPYWAFSSESNVLKFPTVCSSLLWERNRNKTHFLEPTHVHFIIVSSSHYSTSRKKLSWFPVPFHSFHSKDYCIPPHLCPMLEVNYDQTSVHLCCSSLQCSLPVASPSYLLF